MRGNKAAKKTAFRILAHIFISGIEEQLVVVTIEVGMRNNHRAADVAAWIVVAIVWLGNALVFQERIFRAKNTIAGIEISAAVEVVATALANCLERNWALGEFRTVG